MHKFKASVLELIETGILSVAIILAIYMTIGAMELVWGSSMEPNFHTGERVLVDKIFRTYNRGDVVVLIPPNEQDKHYIKRIVGLPGDIFKVYDCKVYIIRDSKKFTLNEHYLPKDLCTSGGPALKDGRSFKVPDDQYIVLGDNRTYSIDSRYFGAVAKNRILGRVIFRFWPIWRFGFVF